jgi:hypothetical protein
MKTAACRRLFDYWNERRGSRAAPERGDLDPGAIAPILSDSFMLAVDAAAGHPLRLAGTRMCALFCREIKGVPFENLFPPECRRDVGDLVVVVADELAPVVAGVTVQPAGDLPAADVELLLLPLYVNGRRNARVLGLFAPLVVPYWIGTYPVVGLSLGAWRHLRVVAAPPLVPVRLPAAIRRSWVVLDGGRR